MTNSSWLKIEELPRPACEVDFPRKDPATGEPVCKVLMQILTQADLHECYAEAERYTQEKLKDSLPGSDERSLGYDAILAGETSLNILFRAVLNAEDRSRLFPSVREAAQALTQNEVGMLTRQYLLVQAELGPQVGDGMTKLEVDGFIEALADVSTNSSVLGWLNDKQLVDLMVQMARRVPPRRPEAS